MYKEEKKQQQKQLQNCIQGNKMGNIPSYIKLSYNHLWAYKEDSWLMSSLRV